MGVFETHRLLVCLVRLSFALLLLLTAGCEDVIRVNFKDPEPQVVIDGRIANDSNSYFLVLQTSDFYDTYYKRTVTGAQIVVTDELGNADTLVDKYIPGAYIYTRMNGVPGRTYHATVRIEDQTYEATTTIPLMSASIDSLSAHYQKGGGIGAEEDKGYRVHVFFTDTPGLRDYMRIELEPLDKDRMYTYLYDGKFSDGRPIEYEYFLDVFEPGDEVEVRLMSMDRKTYDFLWTLNEVILRTESGNTFDVSPANPNGNWSGGALGYFGGFNVTKSKIIIPDEEPQAGPPDAVGSRLAR